jgi:hypothetical protein
MPDAINPKPFTQIAFTLGAAGTVSARQQYEMASAAVLYFAEGPGISPGQVAAQFDEEPEFRMAVGDYVRVRKFDKVRLINKGGIAVSGVIFVSADPDFLYMTFPRGL